MKLYYYPRMMLLVRRDPTLVRRDALYLNRDGAYRACIPRAHAPRSDWKMPWAHCCSAGGIPQWGSYSTSHSNARHWCLQHQTCRSSQSSGFYKSFKWPWFDTGVAMLIAEGEKKKPHTHTACFTERNNRTHPGLLPLFTGLGRQMARTLGESDSTFSSHREGHRQGG